MIDDHIRRKGLIRLYDILLLTNKKVKADKTTIIVDLSKYKISCKICGEIALLTNPKFLEPKQFLKYKEILQEEIQKFKIKHKDCKLKSKKDENN